MDEKDLHVEFEGVWNYQKLKVEKTELDFTQEVKLEVDDRNLEEEEKELKSAKEEKLEEDEDGRMLKDGDSNMKREKDPHAGIASSSTPCSSLVSNQERNLSLSSRPSRKSAKSPKNTTIAFSDDTSAQQIHKANHTDKRPFRCNECDSSFSRSDRLKVHMRKHSGQLPYRCGCCCVPVKLFLSQRKLWNHRQF